MKPSTEITQTCFCPWPAKKWNKTLLIDYLVALGLTRSQIKKSSLNKSLLKLEVQRCLEDQGALFIPLNLINFGHVSPYYDGPRIKIIYNDENFVAVYKPARIHSYSLTYLERDSCQNYLRISGLSRFFYNYPQNSYDKGLLYRLDYETSGILVFSKNYNFYSYFMNKREDLVHQKIYKAIVCGKMEVRGQLKHRLMTYGKKRGQVKVIEDNQSGKLAVLDVLETQYNKELNQSLVTIRLVTGHRHQIRVQLSSMGFPILGDPLYGGSPHEKMMLQAFKYEIEFEDNNYAFYLDEEDGLSWT